MLPFETIDIYITLDDDKSYQLKSDFSKKEVDISKVLTENRINNDRVRPFIVIHKKQFDAAKAYMLDKENPFKIDKEKAKFYNKIGFLSKGELERYLNLC